MNIKATLRDDERNTFREKDLEDRRHQKTVEKGWNHDPPSSRIISPVKAPLSSVCQQLCVSAANISQPRNLFSHNTIFNSTFKNQLQNFNYHKYVTELMNHTLIL